MRFRDKWTQDDLDAINEALQKHYRETQANTDKNWVKYINPHYVYQALADGTATGVLVDGYLIVFDYGSPWYNPEVRLLDELLVLRIAPKPGNFRSVINALDVLCAAFDCDGILVGDALQGSTRLARLYARCGFTPQATQLMKGKPKWAKY